MNEDTFNTSLRGFLKKVGITSQREIEKAVRDAFASGRLKGHEKLPAKMVLTVGGVTSRMRLRRRLSWDRISAILILNRLHDRRATKLGSAEIPRSRANVFIAASNGATNGLRDEHIFIPFTLGGT